MIKCLFPNAQIVLDRFHIIQHPSREMMTTRIVIMKNFDKQSLSYRAMKNHWRIFQKDSRKLSDKAFYSRTFRQTLTPREIVNKTLAFSDELHYYDDLYQLLLFHLQEKNADHFFDLLTEAFPQLNQAFRTALSTLVRYRKYVTNAIHMPYSNSKLEAINKLISFLQTQTCRYGYVFLQILEFSQR